MENRERKISINLYLNEDEFDLLNAKVRLSGLPNRSVFLRQLIFYGIVYNVDYSHLKEQNWLLSNMANNINQIAHQANANGHISDSEVKRSRMILEDVWQLLRSTQSNQQ